MRKNEEKIILLACVETAVFKSISLLQPIPPDAHAAEVVAIQINEYFFKTLGIINNIFF